MKIIKYPNKMLKMVCEPVDNVNDDIRKILDDMVDTIIENNGIGLAGNQVGILKRLVVIKYKDIIYKLVNPEIIKTSINKVVYRERCLSFPNMYADVDRYLNVEIKYLNENGEEKYLKCNGLLSICVQHEISHLNGETMLDLIPKVKKMIMLKRLKKRI